MVAAHAVNILAAVFAERLKLADHFFALAVVGVGESP
jgi:hypothetical protein